MADADRPLHLVSAAGALQRILARRHPEHVVTVEILPAARRRAGKGRG